MGFKNGAFATVWQVDPDTDNHTKIQISINRKVKETGEYKTEFNGFVDCWGRNAALKAADLKKGDRIQLGSCDVTNSYNKETGKSYVYYKVFAFEMADTAGSGHDSVDSGEPEVDEPAEKPASSKKKPLPF